MSKTGATDLNPLHTLFESYVFQIVAEKKRIEGNLNCHALDIHVGILQFSSIRLYEKNIVPEYKFNPSNTA